MTANPELITDRKIPTVAGAAIFRGKTFLLQIKRAIFNATDRTLTRHRLAEARTEKPVIATSRTQLWTETNPAERFLVAGKIHNLRVAAKKLDGVVIPTGTVFSFWKQLGRASRLKGYVAGRELREGCIIPNIGGGLCQLSNALYDAALDAGCEIVERHAHTQVIPGSLAEKGRDATVFWNYIDLRFRSDQELRIEARLDSESLTVQFRGDNKPAPELHQIHRAVLHNDGPNSCATCETDCHRVVDKREHADFGRTAFLVDEYSAEFDAYITANRTRKDLLFVPLDGRRFRKGNYAWTTAGFGKVRQSAIVTAKRSYRSRKLAAQGAARQMNLLRMYEELAESYAARLSHEVLHVVVHQNLLPFLWRNGHLGGRTFDVLMTALPMYAIHDRLDEARRAHPESPTLGDFRARPDLIDAERDALRHARKIVTTHSAIAAMFPRRSELLDWQMPAAKTDRAAKQPKPVIVFPASTVGRKGCYELREAVRGMDVRIILLGPIIEGADFWEGFDIERGSSDWLERADVIVLPAFVEHRPRRLLLAAAAKIPVIASMDCGVSNVDGITTLESTDAIALRDAILKAVPDLIK